LLGLLVVLMLLGGVYLLRQPLFGGLVADRVSHVLSKALGVPVRVDKVLGSWVADARVEKIRLDRSQTTGTLVRLDADVLEVHFNLWQLLAGEAVEGIRRVKAEGLQIEMDFTRAAPAPDPQVDTDVEADLREAVEAVPRALPPIDIDATIVLTTGLGRFVVRDVVISTPEPTVLGLDAEAIEFPGPVGTARGFSARVRRTADGLVWESRSEIAGVVLEQVELNEAGGISVTGDVAGAALSITAGEGVARLDTGAMHIARVPPWVLGLIEDPLLRPTSGELEIHFEASRLDPIEASAEVIGRDLVLPRQTIDALRVGAELRGDDLVVSAQLQAPGSSVSLRDLALGLGGEGVEVRGLGGVDLATDDLRTFVDGLDRRVSLAIRGRRAAGRSLEISQVQLRGEGVQVDGSGRLDLGAARSGWTTAPLEARLSGRVGDLTLGDLAIGGRLDIDLRVGGYLGAPAFEGTARGAGLAVGGVHVADLELEGRYASDGVDVRSLALRGEAGRIEGSGRIALAPLRFDGVALRVDVGDLAALGRMMPGASLPPLVGAVAGEVALDGTPEELGGRAALRFEDLVFDGVELGDGRLSAAADAGRVTVSALEVRAGWGRLAATARYDLRAKTGELSTLTGEFRGQAVSLSRPVVVDFSDGVGVAGLSLEALGGRIEGSAQLTPDFRGRVTFSDLDLAVLRTLHRDIPAFAGRASGTLGHGPDGLALTLDIPQLRYEEHTGSVSLSIREAQGAILVDALAIDAGELLVAEGAGRVPLQMRGGRLVPSGAAAGSFSLTLRSERVRALLDLPLESAEVVLEGEGPRFDARLDLRKVQVLDGIDPLERVRARIRSGPDGTRIEATLEQDPRAEARVELTSPTAWAWTDPREVPEQLEDVRVEGTLEVEMPNAAAIVPFLPDVVLDAAGPLRARLAVSGPLPYPELTGGIDGRDLRLRLRDVPDEVLVPALTVRLEGGELRIREARLRYGSAVLGADARVGVPPEYDKGWRRQPFDSRARLSVPELAVLNDVLGEVAPVGGSLEGSVRIRGTLQEPKIDGRLEGRDVSLRVPELDERLRVPRLVLAFDDRRVTIEALRIEHEHASLEATGTLTLPAAGPVEPETIDADLRVAARVDDVSKVGELLAWLPLVAGSIEGQVTARGPLTSPEILGRVTARSLQMRVEGFQSSVTADELMLRLEADRIAVEETTVTLGTARARVSGHVGRPARLDGDWGAQPITMGIEVDVPDLSLLRELDREIARLSGGLGGSVDIGGRLGDPELSGVLTLRGVGAALPGSLPSIDTLTGRLVFRGRRLDFEGVRGAFGHGPFQLGGSLTWPERSEPTLDIALRGQRVLLVRNEDIRLRADLDLTVKGPWSGLETRGNAGIADLLYIEPMAAFGGGGPETSSDGLELFTFEDPPLDTMRFDVRVRASDSIRLRTNMIKGNASADIRLRGVGRAPAPEGRISFPGLLIKLPFSTLKVDQGSLTFRPGQTTDPELRATARTRMQGYELTVIATGTLADISIRVSSVPPLSQSDAILLLSTGATSEQLREEGLARAALSRIGSFFGKSLLSGGGRGPRDPDEEGFFDRFTFVQGREISRSGSETLEAEVRLTGRFYLRLERDRHDDFNAGVVWQWRFR
jgi:autotransporter translocation and assembly factor TamB